MPISVIPLINKQSLTQSHLLLYSVDNDQISSLISAVLSALRPAHPLTAYEKPVLCFQ